MGGKWRGEGGWSVCVRRGEESNGERPLGLGRPGVLCWTECVCACVCGGGCCSVY